MNRPLEIFLEVEQIGKLEGGDDDNHHHDDDNHDNLDDYDDHDHENRVSDGVLFVINCLQDLQIKNYCLG